jgi:hypothetical protein
MKHLITILALHACCINAMAQQHDTVGDAATTKNQADTEDLLRFTNNDTLHGRFHGFIDGLSLNWKSPQAIKPILFTTDKIHRIVLAHGDTKHKDTLASIVTLTNGDILNGKVISANSKQISMETQYLGPIEIPRNCVSSISLNPHGGKLYYYGPLNDQGWKTIATAALKKPDLEDDPPIKPDTQPADKKPTDKKLTNGWELISNSWYTEEQNHYCLVRDNALPDKCRLSFELSWRGSPFAQIGLFADLSPPKFDSAAKVKSEMASAIGNAYTVYINAHSVSLYAYHFNEEGELTKNRIDGSCSISLQNKEQAQVELRIDREKQFILLYLDGEFKIKWPIEELPSAQGNALVFFKPSYTHTPCKIRIRDIAISQWNGLQDSARSARSDKHDIILLSNGLDRYSGTFKQFKDGVVSFNGSYGNELVIPSDEITEINFATNNLLTASQQAEQSSAKQPVYFYTLPYGRISATPVRSEASSCTLHSDLLGTIRIDTNYVNLIDFSHQNNLLDFWDENF